MNECEKQILVTKALGMTEEQAKVIIGVMPTWMLWKEIENRLTDLMDFKSKFDDLSAMSDKVQF